MLGWTILFALMALLGMVMAVSSPASVSTMLAATFGLLFFLSLVIRLVRGRA